MCEESQKLSERPLPDTSGGGGRGGGIELAWINICRRNQYAESRGSSPSLRFIELLVGPSLT